MITRGTGLGAILVASVAAAVAVVALPIAVALWAIIAGVIVVTFVVIRAATRGIEQRAPKTVVLAPPISGVLDDLRVARLFYYGGMASIGLLSIRPMLAYTLSDWLFLVAAGITAGQLILSGRVRTLIVPLPPLLLTGVSLFAIGGLISSFTAYSPMTSFAYTVQAVYLTLVWFWLGPILLPERRHLYRAIGLWGLSAAICGFGAVLQLLYGSFIIPGGLVHDGRATGFTYFYNNLGGLTAIAFIPALTLVWKRHLIGASRLVQFGLVVVIALLATGLTLSGSVGGLLALVVGMYVYLAMVSLSGRAVLAICAAFALFVFATNFSSSSGGSSPLQRLPSTLGASGAANGTSTVAQRTDGYRIAWKRIKADPVVGVGLDVSPYATADTGSVHNILLGTFYEAGLFGFLGIIFIITAILRLGIDALRTGDEGTRALAKGLLAAMVVMLVFGMSEPVIDERFCWVPAAMLIVIASHRRREAALAVAHERASLGNKDLSDRGSLRTAR